MSSAVTMGACVWKENLNLHPVTTKNIYPVS